MGSGLGPEGIDIPEVRAVVGSRGVLIEHLASVPAGADLNISISVDPGKQFLIERAYASITTDVTAQVTVSFYVDPGFTPGIPIEVKNRSIGFAPPDGIIARSGNTLSGSEVLFFERALSPIVQTSFVYAINNGQDLIVVVNNGDAQAADLEVVFIGAIIDI